MKYKFIAGAVAALLLAGGAFAFLRSRNSGRSTRTVLDPSARVATIHSNVRTLQEALNESARDRWDPQYVVSVVGADAGELVTWVRNNTAWIPYHGVLRGAAGVLMDRQGNSLDRSVLLATLLETAGHKVRLVHTRLSFESASALLPGLVAQRHTLFAVGDEAASGVVPATYEPDRYGENGSVVAERIDEQERSAAAVIVRLQDRVAKQTQRLLTTLQQPPQLTEWSQRMSASISALEDHWWVQLYDGEKWRDMDITSPSRPEPDQTLDIKTIPDSLYQRVLVRVVAEETTSESEKTRQLLEYSLTPAKLIGERIVLQFWPGFWPAVVPAATAQLKADLVQRASSQKQWTVSVVRGQRSVASATITSSAKPSDASVGGLGGLGQAMGQAFSDSSAPKSALTAVWLEYETQVPGTPAQVERRDVFDLRGPARRAAKEHLALPLTDAQKLERGLALISQTEIMVLPCDLSAEFVAHLSSKSVVENRDLLISAANGTLRAGSTSTDSILKRSAPAPSPLYNLALARAQWSVRGHELFTARPSILTRRRQPIVSKDSATMRNAIDIVANEAEVDLGVTDGFAARVEQGVFDTAAEALFFGGVDNTSEAYSERHRWEIHTNRYSELPADLSGDARQRIAGDLHAGFVVVAPERSVRQSEPRFDGWWRIDPLRGDVLGMSSRGWGQAGEYGMQIDLFTYMSEQFIWEHALCQAVPATINSLKIIGAQMEDEGWTFCWMPPAARDGVDPREVMLQNASTCLVSALAAGFLATAPLVLLTLRYESQAARMVNAMPLPLGSNPAFKGGTQILRRPPLNNTYPYAGKGTQSLPRPPVRGGTQKMPSPNAKSVGPSPSGKSVGSPSSKSVAPPSSKAAPRTPPPEVPEPQPRPAEPPAKVPEQPAKPPRQLRAIEKDMENAQESFEAADKVHQKKYSDWINERKAAIREGRKPPDMPDEVRDSYLNKAEKQDRIDDLKQEYLRSGGKLGYGGRPSGRFNGDLESIANDIKASQEKYNALRQRREELLAKEAEQGALTNPSHVQSEEFEKAFLEQIDEGTRLRLYQEEYQMAGGELGPNGEPMGPAPPRQGWQEGPGLEAGNVPASPPPAPQNAGSGTQPGLGNPQPPGSGTQPGLGNPQPPGGSTLPGLGNPKPPTPAPEPSPSSAPASQSEPVSPLGKTQPDLGDTWPDRSIIPPGGPIWMKNPKAIKKTARGLGGLCCR